MNILTRQEFDEYFKDFYKSYPITDHYKQLMWNAYSLDPKYLKSQAKILLSSIQFLKYQIRIALENLKKELLKVIEPICLPVIKFLNKILRNKI